jgi:hypothetical protein
MRLSQYESPWMPSDINSRPSRHRNARVSRSLSADGRVIILPATSPRSLTKNP